MIRPWRAGVATVALDVGVAVWRHREALGDDSKRPEASAEVAWVAGEAAARGAAQAGAATTTSYLLGQAGVAAGATFLGASAVTYGAPLVLAGAAGWATTRGVQALRRRRQDPFPAPYAPGGGDAAAGSFRSATSPRSPSPRLPAGGRAQLTDRPHPVLLHVAPAIRTAASCTRGPCGPPWASDLRRGELLGREN